MPATTGDGARARGAASQVSTPRCASTTKMSAPQPSTTWAAAISTVPRTSGPTHEARPERGPSSAPTPTSSANNGYVAYSQSVSTWPGPAVGAQWATYIETRATPRTASTRRSRRAVRVASAPVTVTGASSRGGALRVVVIVRLHPGHQLAELATGLLDGVRLALLAQRPEL